MGEGDEAASGKDSEQHLLRPRLQALRLSAGLWLRHGGSRRSGLGPAGTQRQEQTQGLHRQPPVRRHPHYSTGGSSQMQRPELRGPPTCEQPQPLLARLSRTAGAALEAALGCRPCGT